ncbi:MAG TPA: ABC transporter permease [Gammaproteobacteria bacterium]|nr:ABC transporter permease [Gammaproteobacteria bacterium]
MTDGKHWLMEGVALSILNLRIARRRPMIPLIMIVGFTVVVLVMILVLSLGQGLSRAFAQTGSADVAIVLSSGAYSEPESHFDEDQVRAIGAQPGVMHTAGGTLISPEFVSSVSLPKQGSDVEADVVMRGVTVSAFQVHGQIHIVAGRQFNPGVHEVIVGQQATREYQGLKLGDTIHSDNNTWKVVGIFAAGGGLRESEIWTDAAGLQTAFHMGATYSDVYVKLDSPTTFAVFKSAIKRDPRLDVQVFSENRYYDEMAENYTKIIETLGIAFAALMGLGAIIGAVNLMFASLGTRMRETAILRALGFNSASTTLAMLMEMMYYGLIGGMAAGLIGYLLFNGYQAGTTMGNGFSQVAFQFVVTPGLLSAGIVFALIMGFVGGLFPAIRTAHLPVAKALRET